MFQGQYFLIVLGIIVVGIAVMLGVRGFEEGRERANLDALASDTYEMAVDAQKWMTVFLIVARPKLYIPEPIC